MKLGNQARPGTLALEIWLPRGSQGKPPRAQVWRQRWPNRAFFRPKLGKFFRTTEVLFLWVDVETKLWGPQRIPAGKVSKKGVILGVRWAVFWGLRQACWYRSFFVVSCGFLQSGRSLEIEASCRRDAHFPNEKPTFYSLIFVVGRALKWREN